MAGTTKTRTQRRMEKRQAVILLILVLAVSLASFILGVIVGRRGAERDMALKLRQTEKVLVAQTPVAAEQAAPEKTVEVKNESPMGDEKQETDTRLSFYDDLSKDNAPLGSGINLAPVEEQKGATAPTPPIDLPEQPITVRKSEQVAAATVEKKVEQSVASGDEPEVEKDASLPSPVANGTHAVQIGSFNSAADAIALKNRMLDKGYPAFVVEADLGKKGLWYRVRVGPYADSVGAKQAQVVLEKQEKIKGFVSRQ